MVFFSTWVVCNVRDFKWSCTRGGGVGEEGNGFVPREPLNQKSVREGDIQKNIGSLTLASSTLKALTANTDVLDILGSSNKQR